MMHPFPPQKESINESSFILIYQQIQDIAFFIYRGLLCESRLAVVR